ncbi:fructosamine kinase PKL/CAK/FruK [Fomitiporia mediterranea MF3/22]|uniref:fructosamine kinase PKL/CAK/FruK n=1 Tax=Fomitiporia mediterranea (strain MF3/22) TaxID=694068 RepID=UPI0004408473|nr:fructosamine kinase PKL/CAK/FruK [Fomitiporia mediterranea MF3/22]EJD01488.1 fructosamine kinase PKL/CAK/FruK [Fomitiporia mediterranea MF3/22]
MVATILRQKLSETEPDAEFTFSLPIVTSSSGKRYYAKSGSSFEQEQYLGEAESLKHIGRAAPGLAPNVVHSGVDEDTGQPYLISDYLDIRRHDSVSLNRLATRLATELHTCKSEQGFGFNVPTFCGATKLQNGWYQTWEECYDALIGGLQRGLEERGGNQLLCEKIRRVRKTVIPYLLRPLKVDPVLLHGDLWSGNTGVDVSSNEPVVYDPSSFYGHNETEHTFILLNSLAIARIFGGFTPAFFQKYHELLPKSEPAEQYELRVDLYELFHYLNHALMFGGGGYASSASQKMDRLLKYCPKDAS